MSDTPNNGLANPLPEGPYISIEVRWGNKLGRPFLSENNREIVGTGQESAVLKARGLELVQERINAGEMVVACHLHHNGTQGSLLLGAWNYDAAVHSEPVWTQGMAL